MSDKDEVIISVIIPGSEIGTSTPFLVECIINRRPDLFCPICGEKTIFHYKVNPPSGWNNFVSKEEVTDEAMFNCAVCGMGFCLPKNPQPFILDKHLAIAIKEVGL